MTSIALQDLLESMTKPKFTTSCLVIHSHHFYYLLALQIYQPHFLLYCLLHEDLPESQARWLPQNPEDIYLSLDIQASTKIKILEGVTLVFFMARILRLTTQEYSA